MEADHILMAIGQDNHCPWIERDVGIQFDKWDCPILDEDTLQSSNPKMFFGGDAALGPENIIWASAHAHKAAISIHLFCQGLDLKADRPPEGVNLISQKMGVHEWSYDSEHDPAARFLVPHVERKVALSNIKVEVELGFDEDLGAKEAQRCLNCDVQTVFADKLCIECDACVDICPMDCITFTENAEEDSLRVRLTAPAAQRRAGSVCVGRTSDRPGDGQRRRRLRALRPVRGALSHQCVGHAEIGFSHSAVGVILRMTSFNDFVIRFANVNGSGSASANGMFAKALFRMGVPVATRNIFPSNIQGLPTWFEVRVSENGYLGRREGVDIMVAMNAETYDEDVACLKPGGYLIYDNTRPLASHLKRDDIVEIGIPLTDLLLPVFTDIKQRGLFKNITYLGALSALLNIELDVITGMVSKQYKGKDDLIAPNITALEIGRDYAQAVSALSAAAAGSPRGRTERAIMIDGNAATRSVPYTAVRPYAPGTRSRPPRRLPRPSSSMPTGLRIDPIRVSANLPSCRQRTSSPPSAW